MRYLRFGTVVAFVVMGLVTPLAADDAPFAAIPAQTGIVLRFKNPAASIRKVAEFADQLQPDQEKVLPVDSEPEPGWGDLVRTSAQSVQEKMDGADMERDWWLFATNPCSANSDFVWIVPAIDTAALQVSVTEKAEAEEDDDVASLVHETWVIYGSTAGVQLAKECLDNKMESVKSRMNAEGLTVFTQGDFGAFVDMKLLTTANPETFAEFIEGFVDFLAEWIPDGIQPKTAVDVLQTIINQIRNALSKGINDTEFIAISLAMDAGEIRVENYQHVTADSDTSKFFRANPGSEMEALSSLPPSSTFYLGLQANWKDLTSWTTDILKSIAAGTDSGYTKEHEDVRRGYEELRYGMFAIALPMRPLEQGLLRAMTITEVNDPQRARDLGIQWLALPNLSIGSPSAEQAALDRSTEKYGEYSVDVVQSPPWINMNPMPPEMASLTTLLHGPDGNATRTIYLKDRIVEGMGGSKIRMAAAVRRIAEFSQTDQTPESHFTKTREKLGTNANAIVMVDMGGIAAVSMQAWNLYIDLMAGMIGNAANPIGIAVPVEAEPEGEAPVYEQPIDDDETPLQKPKAKELDDEEVRGAEIEVAEPERPRQKVGELDEGQPGGDDEMEGAAAPVMAAVDFDEINQMKFEKELINLVQSTPSLIGFSLAFEPQASRIRIVVPLQAIQQLVKVGEVIGNRLGMQEQAIPAALLIAPDDEEMELEEEQQNEQPVPVQLLKKTGR